jgi:tetratricopeptide (TPR) repeat protein
MNGILDRFTGKIPGTIILLAVVVVFSVFTIQRNKVWQTELSLLEDSAKKSPGKARIFSNLARTHYLEAEAETDGDAALARMQQVIDNARKALTRDPTLLDAHVHLGNAYAYLGQLAATSPETAAQARELGDMAIDSFSRAILINPEYPDAHVNLGLELSRKGQKQEAIEQYKIAIELNPMHLKARNNLGNVYQSQQQYQLAIEEYLFCLEMYSGMPEVHNNLANSYLSLKRYEEAEQHYKAAINLFKDFGIAHTNLAMAYLEQGKVKEARFHIDEALRIDPNNTVAQSMVSTVPLQRVPLDPEGGQPRPQRPVSPPPAAPRGQ